MHGLYWKLILFNLLLHFSNIMLCSLVLCRFTSHMSSCKKVLNLRKKVENVLLLIQAVGYFDTLIGSLADDNDIKQVNVIAHYVSTHCTKQTLCLHTISVK